MRLIVPLTALFILAGCSDGPGNILSSPESVATDFTSSLIKGDLNGAKAFAMPGTMIESLMVPLSNDLQKIPSASFKTKPCVKKAQTNGKDYFWCEGTLVSAGEPYREFHVFLQGDANGKLKAVEIKTYKLAK